MAPLMGLLQILDGQFSVVFQGLQAFVSQELLDVVKVCTPTDQFRCATAAVNEKRQWGHIYIIDN